MALQEILQVKDDILKNNRELEEKIKSHIDTYETKFKQDLTSFSQRIKKVTDSNDNFMKTLPDINFKLTKIDQIEKFNVKTDHKMSSFEVRISSILEQLEKMKTKYDKIVVDNLLVSGHIGGSRCPYANLSEYLLSNINDVNLLKLEKEQIKKDLKAIKTKNDTIVKQTVNLVDGSVKRCNQYTDNKQKDFQALLDTKMREFNEKIMEIRMNVCKIQMQTEESVNNINIGFDKMKEENKFFLNDLMTKFNEMRNEFTEFKNEQKSKLNIFNKDNSQIKKEIKNIKENIENMIRLLEYQNMNNKNTNKELIESVETFKSKRRNIKASYLGTVRMNIDSPLKDSRMPFMSPTMKKNRKNIFNSINGNDKQKTGEIKRVGKKRNTIAFTGQIFDKKMREELKNKIKEKERKDSPKFLGLFAPFLKNIANYKQDDKDKSDFGDKSSNNKDKLDLNSTIKSIKINEEKNNEINNTKSSVSSQISRSNSDSDSESDTYSLSEENETKKDSKGIRCSSSRKNFRKLTLKGDKNKKKTVKADKILNTIHLLNNNNNENNIHKHNKKMKRRGSVAIFKSVNNMYKNNDISDILTKKFSHQIEPYDKTKKKILQINNMKNSSDEDTKNNYNKNNNNININIINQKEKENAINDRYLYNNQKSKYLNLLTISNNSRLINNYNDLNKKNSIADYKRGNSTQNQNQYNTYSQETLSKNHKINYILTPKKEKLGCKIVSFDLPENTNLPQKVNQIYSLNGKKLKKKPKLKTELISPLDEIYKQQFKKKLKNLSNTNMIMNTGGDDVQKKLLPIFGRTAYIFYNKTNKDGGINLTNSMEINKNKNDFSGFNQIGRNSYFNNLQLNINAPFNVKTFPKIQKKFNTEKNE